MFGFPLFDTYYFYLLKTLSMFKSTTKNSYSLILFNLTCKYKHQQSTPIHFAKLFSLFLIYAAKMLIFNWVLFLIYVIDIRVHVRFSWKSPLTLLCTIPVGKRKSIVTKLNVIIYLPPAVCKQAPKMNRFIVNSYYQSDWILLGRSFINYVYR